MVERGGGRVGGVGSGGGRIVEARELAVLNVMRGGVGGRGGRGGGRGRGGDRGGRGRGGVLRVTRIFNRKKK